MLLTNGWPSSIVDFMQVIEPLADPRSHGADPADAFHLVAPSIPGFAYSRTRGAGWNLNRITRAFAELMDRLGYTQYGAHGGDFGSMVSPALGRLYPGRVIGVHLAGLLSPPPTNPTDLATLTDAERARLDELKRFQRWRRWYATVQATRPQTLAYALTDSPIGQLAWMVDVFKEFTDTTDVLEDAIDRDQFLTNVSLYWLTRTAGSAARLFKETSRDLRQAPERSGVPTGVAAFPREPSLPIRTLAERSHHIVHRSEFERGGHFPAMEVPDLVVNDLREFFRILR